MPVASIIVPAFRSTHTLGVAVGSALRQSVKDVEVLIVGDGVDEGTRAVAEGWRDRDPRVRFLDFPKGANRGEEHRDVAVRDARSDAILYLADDDLLLPHHVENILSLLGDHVFAQSMNCMVTGDELEIIAADLGDPECVAWHLLDPPRNAVSITGTAHSRSFYLRLDRGWGVTPPGLPTDLHMWRAFFSHPDFSGATHPEVSTLQFPAPSRSDMADSDIVDMMARWDAFTRLPDVREQMIAMRDQAAWRGLVVLRMRSINRRHLAERYRRELKAANQQHADDLEIVRTRDAQIKQLTVRLGELGEQLRQQRATVRALRATTSWRVTRPLRWLGDLRRRR